MFITDKMQNLMLSLAVILMGSLANAGFLDTDCYAPKANGGLGFCGPLNVSWSRIRGRMSGLIKISSLRHMQCSKLSVSPGA